MYDRATISGQICTGKTTLFLGLKKRLGWSTFSASQFFRNYARTHGASLQKAEEQHVDITRQIDSQMQDMLKEKHNILLEGWMAGIMADDIPGVLKVLLVCDEEKRIERFMERDHVSSQEAAFKIQDREGSWKKKLTEIYNRSDFWDRSHYDLVVDTTNKSPEEVLTLVLRALGAQTPIGA